MNATDSSGKSMSDNNLPEYREQFAEVYDRMALACEAWIGECTFGMMYEFLSPGQRLLDLGIGTGLSSVLFARAGVEVHGIDASEAMLEPCRRKGFATQLRVHDLGEPLPYSDGEFDHAVCVGVTHFLEDVDPLLAEVARVLRHGGTFAVTTLCPEDESQRLAVEEVAGYPVLLRGKESIERSLFETGFEVMKTTRCVYYPDPSVRRDIVDRIHVVRKVEGLSKERARP
jgi:ubiquinone/menaquinone biosynthesis C-methylase UbiE